MAKVYVVGVGMTKFEKPGKRDWDYPKMAQVATRQALADAGIAYEEVEQVMVGYVYGDSTCGQRAIYEVGLSGAPILNVNNNCATGSSALYLARQFVKGGLSDCVLALGFEKMERGSLKAKFEDRTNPMELHMTAMMTHRGFEPAPPAAQIFGNAAREHQEKYSTKPETFAKIAEKNHRHSAKNPYSQFRTVYSLEQVQQSREIFAPLTKLQCCPTSDGAAAAVVCSEAFVIKHGLQAQAIEIAGMGFTTDTPGAFGESSMSTAGYDMSKSAAEQAYKEAGIRGAQDCQVVELHDCFSANELITYEALGLCPPGGAEKLINDGDVTFGGKFVVNPSGGLISKGHPLGATGIAQVTELSWQLRGMATNRQVPNLKYALQHNIGLGGAAFVSILKLGFPDEARRNPFRGARNPALEIDPEEPTHPNNVSAKL